MLQVQNPHTGRFENVYVSGLPDPVQPQPVKVVAPSRQDHGHPLLIAGIILGAIFGLIMACPPAMRGWVILGLIAGIVWLGWRANTDQAQAQAYAGSKQPVAADYAPRAELVRLPDRK